MGQLWLFAAGHGHAQVMRSPLAGNSPLSPHANTNALLVQS